MLVVMRDALASKAPRNTPGKTRLLLIWLGKSLRPVPTTAAPAASARSGIISGTGLAMAKTTESLAIDDTISGVTMSATARPMNTSAPRMASAMPPVRFSGLVVSSMEDLMGVRSVRPR